MNILKYLIKLNSLWGSAVYAKSGGQQWSGRGL